MGFILYNNLLEGRMGEAHAGFTLADISLERDKVLLLLFPMARLLIHHPYPAVALVFRRKDDSGCSAGNGCDYGGT